VRLHGPSLPSDSRGPDGGAAPRVSPAATRPLPLPGETVAAVRRSHAKIPSFRRRAINSVQASSDPRQWPWTDRNRPRNKVAGGVHTAD
jgi:hypothetical protein